MWALPSCRRKAGGGPSIHRVFRAREEEGEFYSLFGRLKDDRQKFFQYFRMSFSKFENLKQLLHTDIEKKNTQFLCQLPPSLKYELREMKQHRNKKVNKEKVHDLHCGTKTIIFLPCIEDVHYVTEQRVVNFTHGVNVSVDGVRQVQ